jgi:hypothetical protein
MSQWARERYNFAAEWHLLGRPCQMGAGVIVAACGLSLGEDPSKLDRIEDESVIGNRCAACQGSCSAWV